MQIGYFSDIFFFTQKHKLVEKGHFIDLSNEYKFTYAPIRVCSEIGFLMGGVVLMLFPSKMRTETSLMRVKRLHHGGFILL